MMQIEENTYPRCAEPLWVLWRKTLRNGRLAKVPYQISGAKARMDDPSTWTTFDRALRRYQQCEAMFDGIGLVIKPPFAFIDLDGCIDDEDTSKPKLSDTARTVLNSFRSDEKTFPIYAELSQSRTGIHVICEAGAVSLPSFRNGKEGVELYTDRHFCALTGLSFIHADNYEPCGEALQYIFDLFGNGVTANETNKGNTGGVLSPSTASAQGKDYRSDEWIISRASRNAKFSALFDGIWTVYYASWSDGDLALMKLLAFWCNKNVAQMDRIFRQSGMYRPKWNRPDYHQRTIDKALRETDDTLTAFVQRKHNEGVRKLATSYQNL